MAFDQQKCPKCKVMKPFLLRNQRGRVSMCLDCKTKQDGKHTITVEEREVKRDYGTHRNKVTVDPGIITLPCLDPPQDPPKLEK